MRPKINADLPPIYAPLMARENRKRYYVAYGGRDSAKSHSFSRALVLQALVDPLRVLCLREIQKTISDSVHKLLSDQIATLNAGYYFDVHDATIDGKNGAGFRFSGLRDMDATKIKSFEAADVAWVEEGQTVRNKSWGILIPTIRADGSEIWVTFNPDMDSDDTYQRFVVNPPENAWVQKVNWRDNPWRSKVLDQERETLRKRDPDEYEHIYEGKPRTVVQGAIYAKEVTQMIEDGRVRLLPYDPKQLVHTIWDLGWNDQTSIIFVQRGPSEVKIIDYEEESFLRYDQWAKKIDKKPYHYGDHWLPHDGEHSTQQAAGLSAQKQLKPLLGKQPKIIKRPDSVEVPIRSARMMFPRVYMDNVKCARLLDCLRRFRRGVPESTGEPGTPVKDEYRHGADAFGGLSMIVDKLSNTPERPKQDTTTYEPLDRGVGM